MSWTRLRLESNGGRYWRLGVDPGGAPAGGLSRAPGHPYLEGCSGVFVFGRVKMGRIERALISVSDKSGVVEFTRELVGMGVEIVSTGGTAKALSAAGIGVIPIDEVTEFPEML